MKYTILCLAFLFVADAVSAQDGYYRTPQKLKFSVGAEAALNSSATSNGSLMRYGVKAGILGNLAICNRLDIRTGLYYSMKGATFLKGDPSMYDWFTEGDHPVKLRINYLELPLNLLLHIGRKRNFYFGPGAYIAYATGGKEEFWHNSGLSSRNILEDYEGPYYGIHPKTYNRLDYGLLASVGYRLPLGIFVQGQLNWGLANIVKSNQTTTNYGYTISAGWMLHDR